MLQEGHAAGELETRFEWGGDFGAPDETYISGKFDKPVMVHHYPAAVKAFYMARDPERPELALGVDVLAPEGYGEVIGGGERATSLEFLKEQVALHELPQEAFEWYLDLRRYGSVPTRASEWASNAVRHGCAASSTSRNDSVSAHALSDSALDTPTSVRFHFAYQTLQRHYERTSPFESSTNGRAPERAKAWRAAIVLLANRRSPGCKFLQDAQVLDVGCGSGWAARFIAEQAPNGHVVGIDVSDEMIRVARTNRRILLTWNFVSRVLKRFHSMTLTFTHAFSMESLYYYADI